MYVVGATEATSIVVTAILWKVVGDVWNAKGSGDISTVTLNAAATEVLISFLEWGVGSCPPESRRATGFDSAGNTAGTTGSETGSEAVAAGRAGGVSMTSSLHAVVSMRNTRRKQ